MQANATKPVRYTIAQVGECVYHDGQPLVGCRHCPKFRAFDSKNSPFDGPTRDAWAITKAFGVNPKGQAFIDSIDAAKAMSEDRMTWRELLHWKHRGKPREALTRASARPAKHFRRSLTPSSFAIRADELASEGIPPWATAPGFPTAHLIRRVLDRSNAIKAVCGEIVRSESLQATGDPTTPRCLPCQISNPWQQSDALGPSPARTPPASSRPSGTPAFKT